MTVGELIKVLGPAVDIFIKPDGNKTYFEGRSDGIPKIFLDATIREIGGFPRPNKPESNRKYRVEFGVWVDNIKFFDKLIDTVGDISDWSAERMNDFLDDVSQDVEKYGFTKDAEEFGFMDIVKKHRPTKDNFDDFLDCIEVTEEPTEQDK